MPPERSNLVLTPDIPYVEFDVLVCDSLDVEPNYVSDGQQGVREISGDQGKRSIR